MAFFTVCVGRRGDLITESPGLLGEPAQVLAPLHHCNTQRSPLQQSSTWRLASCRRGSFLLLLLLELLDGVHLSPGAHLAHRGGVLALHHQLVGHLVVPL